ncbi:MAG: type VI secretion system lipoprotein TssJ [Fulvimonas sp.]|jgi:type VI secretion system protein VasD|nr:type VI secretion system lipoprotein TssJ [Fulvimonas sp.]
MRMPHIFRTVVPILLCAGLLAGCASSASAPSVPDAAGQVTEPSALGKVMQAVGLAKPKVAQPSEQQLPLRIFTAANLNAGTGRQPLALVIKIYQLKSLDRFNQTPFDAFLDADKARTALGDDLVNSREMLLLPEQRYTSTEHLPPEVRYIGFVALFRAPAAQRWRFAYDVKGSLASGITLGVHACALSSTSGALATELPDDPGSLASVNCPKLGG